MKKTIIYLLFIVFAIILQYRANTQFAFGFLMFLIGGLGVSIIYETFLCAPLKDGK
jgi:hypothetical protein